MAGQQWKYSRMDRLKELALIRTLLTRQQDEVKPRHTYIGVDDNWTVPPSRCVCGSGIDGVPVQGQSARRQWLRAMWSRRRAAALQSVGRTVLPVLTALR